jgi:membrane associated rhomboid family serine protease
VRRALRVDGAAWVVLCVSSCLAAVAVTAACARLGEPPSATPLAQLLDWQPALGLSEPWRLWTCAWVHGSVRHLLVNVAGDAVLAFVGWRARLSPAAALAWLLAWPGTQLLMAAIGSQRLAAAMPHYFGLSGVLHAGVVVLGLSLAWPPAHTHARPRRERWIGLAIVVGTLAKVALEAPWTLAPHADEALGIAVAPIAHACGFGAGLLAWAALRLALRPAH